MIFISTERQNRCTFEPGAFWYQRHDWALELSRHAVHDTHPQYDKSEFCRHLSIRGGGSVFGRIRGLLFLPSTVLVSTTVSYDYYSIITLWHEDFKLLSGTKYVSRFRAARIG